MAQDGREFRGQAIAEMGNQVKRLDAHNYKVNSQSGNGAYDVLSTELRWICSCLDHVFRGVKCKHIWAVEISIALRKKVESSIVIHPITVMGCPKCKSENIKKAGLRHNKCGDLQRFACNDCEYTFTVNLGFEKMKATAETVTLAMQVYFSGLSFEATAKALKLKGVKISNVGVYKWVKKYVGLMEKYLDQITPQVSDTWRTDEMYVKIRGNMKYLFAMMDDDTRFRIAQQVADHKGTSDIRPMFREAKEKAGKKPKVLISDGAHNFAEACTKEWWTMKKETRTEHIREIRLAGDAHNNKMERQNGEWRDREKVMRSLKNDDSPVIEGMEIFHNFIRPHMGLPSKITPAEAAGIKIEGENKWLTIIQNASQLPTVNASKQMPKS